MDALTLFTIIVGVIGTVAAIVQVIQYLEQRKEKEGTAVSFKPVALHRDAGEEQTASTTESLLSNSELVGLFYLTGDKVVARVHHKFEPDYSSGISAAFDRLNTKKAGTGFEGYFAGKRFRPITPPKMSNGFLEINLTPLNYAFVALMKDELSEPADRELVQAEIAKAAKRLPKRLISKDHRFNAYGYNLLGTEVCFITSDGFTLLRRRGKNVLTGRHRWDVSMSGHPTPDDVVENRLDVTHTIRRDTRNEIEDINADPRKIVFIGFHRNMVSGDIDILAFWPVDDTAERLKSLITKKRPDKNTRVFRTTEQALEKYVWDTDNLLVEFNGPAILQALQSENLSLGNLLPEALVCLELALLAQKQPALSIGLS